MSLVIAQVCVAGPRRRKLDSRPSTRLVFRGRPMAHHDPRLDPAIAIYGSNHPGTVVANRTGYTRLR